MKYFFSRVWVLCLCCVPLAWADYDRRPEVEAFIGEMVEEHGFSQEELSGLFAKARRKDSILEAISRPAEKRLEWYEYRNIFVTEQRIRKGKEFIRNHREVLERAEQRFGVPVHIIASVIGVETRYGQHKGGYRVVDALSTLAFDYPPRSKFFRGELKELLLLSREQGFKPLELMGSYAGAMGYGQFIPSSYRHYAIDFDGDGVADILNNVVDAIGSVANYFARHKWEEGQDVAFKTDVDGDAYKNVVNTALKPDQTLKSLAENGVKIPGDMGLDQVAKLQPLQGKDGTEYWVTLHNFYVITRYNHSHLYAMAVFQLAEALRE